MAVDGTIPRYVFHAANSSHFSQLIFMVHNQNMASQCLQSLAQSVLHKFSSVSGKYSTIAGTIPILYFGDAEAYFQSPKRIITVALNPSDVEFFDGSSYTTSFRFPNAASGSVPDILKAYNEYFVYKPYRKWFGHFEKLLNGMDASYYDKPPYSNRVLHTDLLSLFATNPTWSKLPNADRSALAAIGIPTWHELVECLQPDVIIASVSRHHLQKISYLPPSPTWRPIFSKKGKTRTYSISVVDPILLTSRKKAIFVYGTAGRQPLVGLLDVEKKNAGSKI